MAPGGGPVTGALVTPATVLTGVHAREELALLAAVHHITAGPAHPHQITFRWGGGQVEVVAHAYVTVTLTGWVAPGAVGHRFRVTTNPTLPPVEPFEDAETARGAWRDALAFAHAVNAPTGPERARRWAQLTDRQRAAAIV